MLIQRPTIHLARLALIVTLLVGLTLGVTAPPQPTQARPDSFETPDALRALRALPVPALEQADAPSSLTVTWTGAGGDDRWSNPPTGRAIARRVRATLRA